MFPLYNALSTSNYLCLPNHVAAGIDKLDHTGGKIEMTFPEISGLREQAHDFISLWDRQVLGNPEAERPGAKNSWVGLRELPP